MNEPATGRFVITVFKLPLQHTHFIRLSHITEIEYLFTPVYMNRVRVSVHKTDTTRFIQTRAPGRALYVREFQLNLFH